MSERDEIWVCGHTRKCGWKGPEEELKQIINPRFSGNNVTVGTCPRCGSESFYIRCAKCKKPTRKCTCTPTDQSKQR